MPDILEAPPSPPDVVARFGGGGGRGKPPWHLWVLLAVVVISAAGVSLLAVRAVMWQPIAASISLASAVALLTITHRRFYVSDDTRYLHYFAGTILSGMVGVFIQAVVAGPPMGILWLMLGTVGIGGGFGIGAASIVYLWYGVVALAKFLFAWRAA